MDEGRAAAMRWLDETAREKARYIFAFFDDDVEWLARRAQCMRLIVPTASGQNESASRHDVVL